jgi:predicted GH43/DUF377 family glycosyl hydrolase
MTVRFARACARSWRVRALARPLVRAIAAVALALAAARADATAYTRFDFETPSYGAPGRRLSDHQLLKVGATWHLFYTELASAHTPVARIGHAASTDLVHWTERPTVIAAGGQPWTMSGTWAPHVTGAPGGGWVMLFTGENALFSQAIGALTSGDLDTWQLAPENPVFVPPTWARWGPDFTCDCRDPFVYFENGVYSMLYTVQTASPKRSALGRATSLDLLHWADAGPFAIDSVTTGLVPLESSSLVFGGGRVELHFTRTSTQMLVAPTSAGPWDFGHPVDVDPLGAAGEIALDGAVRLLSRVRFDLCQGSTSIIVIDTVATTEAGYDVPGPPTLPPGWSVDGDAFVAQPTYGDGPKLRGEAPAAPEGLRWLASGEVLRQPGESPNCTTPAIGARVGYARSPRFTLLGDLVSFRLSGKTQPDSLYAALVDDCTGQELVRSAAPGTSVLTPASWSNAGRRGWPVRLRLVDLSDSADGVIGLDAVVDSAVGSPAPPAIPLVDETAPAGGENLTAGSTFTIRWTGSSGAGIDSFVVYLSYDDFATAPAKLARRNGNQFTFTWTVPAGPKFNARIRVVIYARNGIHTCDQSGPFSIGATVDVGEDTRPVVSLVARAQPGPAPILEWSAPPGRRATLVLYDTRGRRVRRLYDGPGVALARATWDGRDDAGRPLPPGLYFARLQSGEQSATARVIRLGR